MMRSGFGGKGGSISSRSTGVITTEDNSGGFLNLVRSMAGDDLVMCLEAYGVEGVAVGDTITNWYDSLGVLSTHFTQGTEANRPALALFRNKPVVNFNGSNLMTTAANMSELNGVRDCTVIVMFDHEAAATTSIIAEYTANYNLADAFALTTAVAPKAYSFGQRDAANSYCTNGPKSAVYDQSKPVVFGNVLNRNNPGAGINLSTVVYVNGALVPAGDQTIDGTLNRSQNSGFTSDRKLSLGARETTGGAPFTGRLGALIIINRQLTADEMSRISKALMKRYAVSEGEAFV